MLTTLLSLQQKVLLLLQSYRCLVQLLQLGTHGLPTPPPLRLHSSRVCCTIAGGEVPELLHWLSLAVLRVSLQDRNKCCYFAVNWGTKLSICQVAVSNTFLAVINQFIYCFKYCRRPDVRSNIQNQAETR